MKNNSNSALVIASEKDEEIPKNTTQNYLEFSQDQVTKIVLRNTDHVLSQDKCREDFYDAVENWISEKIIVQFDRNKTIKKIFPNFSSNRLYRIQGHIRLVENHTPQSHA